MENMIEVCVNIPIRRQGEFYIWFGKWLDEEGQAPENLPADSPRPEVVLQTNIQGGSPEQAELRRASWAHGTERELLEDARYVYRKISTNARAFTDFLLDAPEHTLTAAELAEAMNTNIHGVAGCTASFSTHCGHVDRLYPFIWTVDGEETIYAIYPEIADLFRRARG